ncbi:MAG: hypothetical protein ACLT3W_07410 [Bifidobacterium pseudocatenulatum]
MVWKSNGLCPVDTDYRLFWRRANEGQTGPITWPGTRTGSECVEDQSTLPKVDRGVYSAQLSIEGHPKAKSDPVGVTIE